MDSSEELAMKAKIDGISKGLRMGMAEIYGRLLAFDKKNIEQGNPSVTYSFLQQQASDLDQSFEEFMTEQTEALQEFQEYCEALNKLYEVSDSLGYKGD